MRNRAKCKVCGAILESFHKFDYVSCKCGEISISGGTDTFDTSAKDYANFIRVDDQGNEVPVIVSNEHTIIRHPHVSPKERLATIIDQIESLPKEAMDHPLTHYDLLYILRLIQENIS